MKSNTIRIIGIISIFLFLIIISITTLLPLIFLVIASFKPAIELFRFGLSFNIDISKLTLKNYEFIFSREGSRFTTWFFNSIKITVVYVIISLFFSSMVGYALGVYHFKGKRILFYMVLFTMMLPIELLILPLYKEMVYFKLIDTCGGVILPFAVSPMAVFFFRQYASTLPKELMDSARIDGCSEYRIYFQIMMPLMLPAIGAMVILLGMNSWNSFIWPLIVLRSEEKFTLPIGLSALLTPYGNDYETLIAGSVVSILPVLILFIFNQRAFISGLTLGGIKG
nr:carbohydrate ABC transporter permease [Caldicellulosiruptor owensensis]